MYTDSQVDLGERTTRDLLVLYPHAPCVFMGDGGREILAKHSVWIVFLLLSVPCSAAMDPWLYPGEAGLRHDLQLLGDGGLINTPLMTWPISLEDVARSYASVNTSSLTQPVLEAAYERVGRRLEQASPRGKIRPQVRLAVSSDPLRLRSFAETPRESAEAGAGLTWTGERWFYRLQVTAVANPDDEKAVRLDGSYFGGSVGNWILAMTAVDRWWGPGWEGSLILSDNSRPVPGMTIQRRRAEPFTSPLLSWVGPWQLIFFLGQLEHQAFVPDAKLMGIRLTLKPTPRLEIGVSRTAQWGGKGRPEGLPTLVNLLIGRENRGDSGITLQNDPGNQLAGYDLRWASPLFDLPYAVYGQLIGEDEAGGNPSRFIGLVGAEVWGATGEDGRAGYRAHIEFADTAAGFYRSSPYFNYAYEHGIYQSGYRYYGRSLGHSLDSDGRMTSIGALRVGGSGRTWEALVSRIEPNRDAAGATTFWDGTLRHAFNVRANRYMVAAGFQHQPGNGELEGHAALRWVRMF